MFKIGAVCLKIAGRDAGKKCVIVEELEEHMVLVEGETRRRKVNMKHIEPTGEVVKVKKGDSHDSVMKALGIEPRKSKPKKSAERPRKRVAMKPEPVKKAPAKKSTKKVIPEKPEEKNESPKTSE